MLHQGSKLSFGGASKGFKTWSLDNLALSVAYGLPWFGCETRRSKVLLIDLELQEAFCRRRLLTLEHALGIFQEPRRLDVWNLRRIRGRPPTIAPPDRRTDRHRRLWARGCGPDLQVVRGRRNENAAADIAALMNALERLCSRCHAAVAFGAHYLQGQSGRQRGHRPHQRFRGFARDPDSLLNLTAHEQEDCYTLEASLRNFPQLDPFVVRWEFPLFVRDDSLDPAA